MTSEKDHYKIQLEHLVKMAQTPGFTAHAKYIAEKLEECPSGMWRGITKEARGIINNQKGEQIMAQVAKGEA